MPGAPNMPAPPLTGSPFVVGRPLRAHEPIFGRDAALRFLADALAHGSSVNLVAPRRMGKTSLLSHLRGRQSALLPPRLGQPPLLLAAVDLQGQIGDAGRFYAAALYSLWRSAPTAARPPDWQSHVAAPASLTYEAFAQALRDLAEGPDPRRPVLLLDEFERLLADDARAGFPFPGFFDGLRALVTADVLTIVVASLRPLADYFSDPQRAFSLTSTFPSYFIPCPLSLLDETAADALLLQGSDHPLGLAEARAARAWAGGHPCHLQAAGQAWYEAHVEGRSAAWAETRFQAIKGQACLVGRLPPPVPAAAIRAPELSTAQIHALVDALLGCTVMQDRGSRDTVVGDLPPAVRHHVTRSARDREDVRHILGAALAYPDGLAELVRAVRFYEGDSLGMQALARVLAGLLREGGWPP